MRNMKEPYPKHKPRQESKSNSSTMDITNNIEVFSSCSENKEVDVRIPFLRTKHSIVHKTRANILVVHSHTYTFTHANTHMYTGS